VPDELPRIHEAFAPLPPKDWRLLHSVTVPMSGKMKNPGLVAARVRGFSGEKVSSIRCNGDARQLP
jgi:hypothetical protein